MNTPDQCIACLEKTDFYDHLSAEERQFLHASTRAAHYPAGTLVHSAQERCHGVLLIREGALRIYMLSEDGREITLYRLHAGDTCILAASCVLDAISFDVFIEAETETDALLTEAPAFRRLVEQNVYVSDFAHRLATERFSDVMWTMQQILFMGVDKRLAIYLWDRHAESGTLRLTATQEQIASSIGSAREVVSRMLKYFASEGIVKVYRGGIEILDKDRLKAIAL